MVVETVAQEGRGHRHVILFDVDEFGGQLDLESPFGEALPQYFFDAKLGDDEGAGVGNSWRGVAAFMHILVSKDGGSTVAAEGKVKASVGQDFVDESQVVEKFEGAGLQSFPRDPAKWAGDLSMMRKLMPRRARSQARVRPVGPAPTISTGV
jgi:hypothetical protein